MPPTSSPPATGIVRQADLQIEYVDGHSLLPADYNPRLLRPAKRARLKESLRAHGFVDPAVARREDRLLIGGHQRIDVWVNDLGGQTVPVVFLTGVSDAQAKALNIALNNPDLMGEFDLPKLQELVLELDALPDFDAAALTGFDEQGIVNLKNWEPPKLVPTPKQQEQPQLKSERLIEIRGTDTAVADIMGTLGEWAEHPGLTITIT